MRPQSLACLDNDRKLQKLTLITLITSGVIDGLCLLSLVSDYYFDYLKKGWRLDQNHLMLHYQCSERGSLRLHYLSVFILYFFTP